MDKAEKRALSERDICTKFITPALVAAQWDVMNQIREEVYLTKGRVIVRGQLSTRGEPKRADYVLCQKPGVPLAVIEAKDNTHPVGAGMQQALAYAGALDVPFAVSSNGDAFLMHDLTGRSRPVEREIALDAFPSPADQGLDPVESPDALKVTPFPAIGTPVEIVRAFGGRRQYQAAVRSLENEIYA